MDLPLPNAVYATRQRRPAPSALARPLWAAVGLAALLVALSVGQDVYIYGLPHAVLPDKKLILDVDYEKSLYTWLSSTLMFSCAALLAWVAEREAGPARGLTAYWRGLALVFVLLSADEHVGAHERASEWLAIHLPTHGLFYFGWVMLALPLCLAGAVVSLRALRALEPATRRTLLLAATVFVTGAVGVEMLGGAVAEAYGEAHLTYHLMANLEEGLEVLGLLIFLFGLDHHRRRLGRR